NLSSRFLSLTVLIHYLGHLDPHIEVFPLNEQPSVDLKRGLHLPRSHVQARQSQREIGRADGPIRRGVVLDSLCHFAATLKQASPALSGGCAGRVHLYGAGIIREGFIDLAKPFPSQAAQRVSECVDLSL